MEGHYLLTSTHSVVAAGAARLAIFIQQTNSKYQMKFAKGGVPNNSTDPYLNADGIGHLTTEIYWSMIEMGISVVAACLPAIWPLLGKASLESMVHTVRSMFSLESMTRSAPGRSRDETGANGKNDGERGSESFGPHERSSEGLDEASVKGFKVGTIPMRDLEAQ